MKRAFKLLRGWLAQCIAPVRCSAWLDGQTEVRQTILSQVERISESAGLEDANDQLMNGNCVIIGVLLSGKGNALRLRYLIGHLRASSQSRNSLGHETSHCLQHRE